MESCKKYELNITLLAEGSLEEPLRSETLEHIERCESCKGKYEQTLTLLGLVKSSSLPEPSGDFLDRLIKNVGREISKKDNVTRLASVRQRKLKAFAAMAATFAVVFFSVFYIQYSSRQQAPVAELPDKSINYEESVDIYFEALLSDNFVENSADDLSFDSYTGDTEDYIWIEEKLSDLESQNSNDLLEYINTFSEDEARDILEELGTEKQTSVPNSFS
ncbi:MAG TPA: hypothetical protein PLN69_02605 [bacterium]|nr:hypothetical protein [bacterium]